MFLSNFRNIRYNINVFFLISWTGNEKIRDTITFNYLSDKKIKI